MLLWKKSLKMPARDQFYTVCMFEVGVYLQENWLTISHKKILFGEQSEKLAKVSLLIWNTLWRIPSLNWL